MIKLFLNGSLRGKKGVGKTASVQFNRMNCSENRRWESTQHKAAAVFIGFGCRQSGGM